jgi:hypothetical protein
MDGVPRRPAKLRVAVRRIAAATTVRSPDQLLTRKRRAAPSFLALAGAG